MKNIQIINEKTYAKNKKRKKKDYFGALKGIGSFKEEDKAKGQLD